MNQALASLALDTLESVGMSTRMLLEQEFTEENIDERMMRFLSDIIAISKKVAETGLCDVDSMKSLGEYVAQQEAQRGVVSGDLGPLPEELKSLLEGNATEGAAALRAMLRNALSEAEPEEKPEEAPKKRTRKKKEEKPEEGEAKPTPLARPTHPDDEDDEEVLRRIRKERLAKQQEQGLSEGPAEVQEFHDFD